MQTSLSFFDKSFIDTHFKTKKEKLILHLWYEELGLEAAKWVRRAGKLLKYGFTLGKLLILKLEAQFYLICTYTSGKYLLYGDRINWECEICSKRLIPVGTSRTARSVANVDHHHETGRFRGFLCNSCNVGSGCLKYVQVYVVVLLVQGILLNRQQNCTHIYAVDLLWYNLTELLI
jgi:hypothetical protein